jgi:general secretion pathway protein L
MDRQTPFSADEVYWNHQIEDVDRPRGTISVRLTLLPKAHLANLLTTLARAGIAPRWSEIEDSGDEGPHLPFDGGHGPKHRTPRLLWPAAVCCAILAVGVVATPFIRQALELATLGHEIEAVRPMVTQAEVLRREVDQLLRNADLVKAELDQAGRPLQVLAAITRLLPDDTYLIEAELRRRKVTLTGRSAGAARLIPALASDGRFRNPAFAAPVTRIDALRPEVFTIVAEVEPLP